MHRTLARHTSVAAALLLATSALTDLAHAADRGVFNTTITVDTSTDPDDSTLNKTCSYSSGGYTASSPCSLRRALIEASVRPQGDRPVKIQFGLAGGDPGCNAGQGTCTLFVTNSLPPLETDTILDLNGAVTIDGTTQPGGRSGAPPIIVDTAYSLEVESENNTIRGIAIQGGGGIALKEDGNTVERIWLGLTADGTEIAFVDAGGSPLSLAGSGITILSSDNRVEESTISGSSGRAIAINSGTTGNVITLNQIGTRADGTVPDVPDFARCQASTTVDGDDWYGGWGISVSGTGNEVSQNTIAGLQNTRSTNDTPPIALEVFGTGHLITANQIGLDSAASRVGVCGQGIKVAGNDTDVTRNAIVASRAGFLARGGGSPTEGAIYVNDSSPSFGEITIRQNVVDEGPGKVVEFGPSVPNALKLFEPAEITSVVGTTVTGTAGAGSPCPGCTIDLYVDDRDDEQEALEWLDSTDADGSGNFTFVDVEFSPASEGLRTSSTVNSGGIITGFSSGTTTKLSGLFEVTDIFEDDFEGGTTGGWDSEVP